MNRDTQGEARGHPYPFAPAQPAPHLYLLTFPPIFPSEYVYISSCALALCSVLLLLKSNNDSNP